MPLESSNQAHQRAALSQKMRAQALDSRRIGFALRGDDELTDQCLIAEVPGTPAGEVSCCGAKNF